MSVAELLPSIRSLPRVEKLELIRLLAVDLARDELSAGEDIALPPSDQCPYSSTELAQMRREAGGRSLADIWRSLGRS